MWLLLPKSFRNSILSCLYSVELSIHRYVFTNLQSHTWFSKFYRMYQWILQLVTRQSQCFRIVNFYCLSKDSLHLPFLLDWLEFSIFFNSSHQQHTDPTTALSPDFYDKLFLQTVSSDEINQFSSVTTSQFKMNFDFLTAKLTVLRSLVQQCVKMAKAPVTKDTPDLDLLWKEYLGETIEGKKNWTLLGFQQADDPCTDFRAMGNTYFPIHFLL